MVSVHKKLFNERVWLYLLIIMNVLLIEYERTVYRIEQIGCNYLDCMGLFQNRNGPNIL
jgi:hypothetical protein